MGGDAHGRRPRPRVLQVGLRVPETLVELRDLLAQVIVLLDQASQLGLDQVEERVNLVLVVPPLANGGFAERDV